MDGPVLPRDGLLVSADSLALITTTRTRMVLRWLRTLRECRVLEVSPPGGSIMSACLCLQDRCVLAGLGNGQVAAYAVDLSEGGLRQVPSSVSGGQAGREAKEASPTPMPTLAEMASLHGDAAANYVQMEA